MIVWRPQLTYVISVHFLCSADLTQDVSVINSAWATCFFCFSFVFIIYVRGVMPIHSDGARAPSAILNVASKRQKIAK